MPGFDRRRQEDASMPDTPIERRTDPGLRELVHRAAEGFVIVAPDRTVRIMNEAAERMLGVDRAYAVGRPYPDPSVLAEIERALAGGPDRADTEVELGLETLHCTISRYESADGPGAVIVVADVTDAERSRDEFQSILSATRDGLVVADEAGVVKTINRAACEILGVACDQVVGVRATIDSLLGTESCEAGAEGGVCVPAEVEREIEMDDPRRIIYVRQDPIRDSRGDLLGSVVTLRDVTTERDVMQMKNEFVSTVSHELRTPLTSIKGYIDLILDGDAGDVDEIQREFLGIVKENTDRLVQLINDMLDISRIESGRIHLNIQPLDVGESIIGAADTFRAVLGHKGHRLEVDVPSDLPLVAGDRDRVGQVLINLTSNAVKYSPEGGLVTLAARAEGGEVVVSVSDEGLGIAPENQPRLFEQFYRVDSAMTREIGGTGLGLSICKSIVELLGGRIWVLSETGAGSTFSFSLPVAGPELVRTPEVEGPLEATGGKVLVIDADPDAAALVENYLARHEYDVIKAYSAAEALTKAAEEHPDVITLDVVLKDMDGFELLQKLKDDPATASIPVVVLSVVCDEGRSCRLGASRYLEKPIDKDRLLKIINDTLGPVSSPLVLVVDDDRDIVDVLKRTLKGKGFSVATAFDGREAMVAVERDLPDLILLDLKMPEMDGYEVIHTLKTRVTTRDIPIVVMTAHQLDAERIHLIEMTAAQVAKPLEATTLAEEIADMLTSEGIVARPSNLADEIEAAVSAPAGPEPSSTSPPTP
jgi:PAS domain S-box-containing protein